MIEGDENLICCELLDFFLCLQCIFLTNLDHCLLECSEIVKCLIGEGVPVHEKQNPLLNTFRVEAIDDLHSNKGLSGARGHYEQETILSFGNRGNAPIDRIALVVSRSFSVRGDVIRADDELSLVVGDILCIAISFPKLSRGWKVIHPKLPIFPAEAIFLVEYLPVRSISKRNI